MNGSIGTRDRRALGAGLVVIAMIVLVGRGLPAWRRWTAESRAAAATAQAELERVRRSVARAPRVADSLRARRVRLTMLDPLVLAPASPSVAAAELATVVSSMATAAGVRVASVQPLLDARDTTTAGAGPLRRIALRVDGVGDVRGIARLLAGLERGPPLMAIRGFTISQPDVGAPHDRVEALHVELTIDALARRDTTRRGAVLADRR